MNSTYLVTATFSVDAKNGEGAREKVHLLLEMVRILSQQDRRLISFDVVECQDAVGF